MSNSNLNIMIDTINLDNNEYNIPSVINKLNLDGVIFDIGLNTSDANAIASDIKQGKTAYVNGTKITGSMPPYGPQTITPTTQNQSFGPGVYLNGQITVLGSPNLISSNIRKGITIFGVTGDLDYIDLLPSTMNVFLNGKFDPAVGGYKIFSGVGSVSIGNSITVSNPAEYSETFSGITNLIDFTKYSTLSFNIGCTGGDERGDLVCGYGNGTSFTNSQLFTQAVTTRTFDIRSVSGSYRPMVRIYRYGSRNQILTINSITLTM